MICVIDDRPVWVTIPTIGASDLLIPLVNALEQDCGVDKILLTVNIEEYVEPISGFFRLGEPTIEVVETWTTGKSLYHGWNLSIELARKENAWLAVLNDDVRLFEPNAISHVSGLLAVSPAYAIVGLNYFEPPESTHSDAPLLRQVHGTYRHYGVGGFAWVCDPHKVELVPNDLIHWGGDDFIFRRASDANHLLGIANHIHVEHPAPETTAITQPWTQEAKVLDRESYERHYPGDGW